MLRRASDGSRDTDTRDHMSQEEDDQTRTVGAQDGHLTTSGSKKDSNMEILVMQFLKNSIVNNPIIVSNVSIHCTVCSYYKVWTRTPPTSS